MSICCGIYQFFTHVYPLHTKTWIRAHDSNGNTIDPSIKQQRRSSTTQMRN